MEKIDTSTPKAKENEDETKQQDELKIEEKIEIEDTQQMKNTPPSKTESKNDRISTPTKAELEDHQLARQHDKIGTANAEMLKVAISATVAGLTNVTNTSRIRNVPLSKYAFGSVSRSISNNYAMSPYVLITDVPQLFKFKATYNDNQQVNVPDMMITKFSQNDVIDVVKKSIELFNISTMTVRVELNDKLSVQKVLDPNDLSQGAIVLDRIAAVGRVNYQLSASFVENRIFSVMSAYLALDDVLVTMPKKIVCLETTRGGPVAEALAQMPFYSNMNPHLFYSVYSNLPDWARSYLNDIYVENPLQIGELAVQSYAGKKLSQINKMIIDQYTSEVLNINYEKLVRHTLTTQSLLTKIKACLLKYDQVEVTVHPDVEDLNLLYDYTHEEYQLFMFRALTSLSTKEKIVNFLVEEMEKTARLTTTEVDQVWKGISPMDPMSSRFNQSWLMSISIGNKSSPYEMLIYETFSDFFDFSMTFSDIPASIEAVIEVLEIYLFMALYPRITQKCINQIGSRLTKLFWSMFPNIFDNFVSEFGTVRTNFGKAKFNSNTDTISYAESQMGYVHSIFVASQRTNAISNRTNNNLLTQFIDILNELRRLVLPPTYQYQLSRKRNAKYPYMYENYAAYASWEPMTFNDYSTVEQTTLGIKLRSILNVSSKLKTLFTNQNKDDQQIPRGFNAYYTAWNNCIQSIVGTCGAAYQVTSAMMQETLFNSPFYFGSQYNPNPDLFWYAPKSIGIGPLVSASAAASILLPNIQVRDFRIHIGINLAMTMEGEYRRQNITPNEECDDITSPYNRPRADITVFNAVECFKMMNAVISESKRFGYAMQFTQWLTTAQDPDNPFGQVAEEIARYMKMATWMPLIRKVYNFFNVNFDEYFISMNGPSSFPVDGRYLDRTLVLVDPVNAMALSQQPLNSQFGKRFMYMTEPDISKVNVLAKPLLSLDSSIIYVHSDWYFGRLFVDELGPTQTNLKQGNWTDETSYNSDFQLSRVPYKNGQVSQLAYRSDITGETKTIILPYTSTNAPVLLIKLDSMDMILPTYLKPLAKAVAAGKIILKIKYLRLRVFIEDLPSKTEDYSEPNMTEDDIFDILSLPNGAITERHFKTTNYASNFSSNALTVPGYIQWFATEKPADRNIFTSVITNAITRPSQTILPTADQLGFGPHPEGKTLTTGVLKTESNVINWNNTVPTISDKLLRSIDINLIPRVPSSMGG